MCFSRSQSRRDDLPCGEGSASSARETARRVRRKRRVRPGARRQPVRNPVCKPSRNSKGRGRRRKGRSPSSHEPLAPAAGDVARVVNGLVNGVVNGLSMRGAPRPYAPAAGCNGSQSRMPQSSGANALSKRSWTCGAHRLWREDLRTGGVARGASGAGAQARPSADRFLIHSRFSKNKRFQSAWCGLKNLFYIIPGISLDGFLRLQSETEL